MTERTVLVRLKANVSDFNRAMLGARQSVNSLTRDIDTSSNRTAWLAQSLLAIGPTLIPIGAAAVPIIAGLTTQLTVAGVAAGTLALAFSGVGDAVKAVNTYQLDPTAQNLEKMQLAMEKLGGDGAHFVRFLDKAGESLNTLKMDARGNMFEGMEQGIHSLLNRLPEIDAVVQGVSQAIGELSRDAGRGIAGPKFDAFFNYLETQAKPILIDMGHILGDFVEGIANLMVAFGPLTQTFSGGFADMADSFAKWSRTLDSNQSFQSFLAYAEESLPRVGDLIGSLVDVFVALVHAAGPVGQLLLPALTGLLEVLAKLADSPLGSVFVALGAAAGIYGRAAALARVTTGGLGSSWVSAAVNAKAFRLELSKTTPTMAGLARAAGPAALNIGIIGASMSGLPEKFGLTNTAMGAMIGMMGGPWGAAIGGGVGLIIDLASGQSHAKVSVEGLTQTLDQQTGAITRNTKEWLFSQFYKDSDLVDAASALGISIKTVTEATLGNANAIKEVNAAYEAGKSGFYDSEGRVLVGAEALQTYGHNMNTVKGAIESTGGVLASATSSFFSNKAATDAAAGAYNDAADAVTNFKHQLEAANRVLDKRASLRDYQAALDDFTAAVKENGKTLDINSPKGRAVQDALDGIARTALKAAENLDRADRPAFLQGARADFVDAATKLGLTTKQARNLATELGLVDRSNAKPKIDMNKAAFDLKADEVQTRLNQLDGQTANTYITTHYATVGNRAPGANVNQGHADGGLITGPGGPRDDKIPAWLSNREFVMSNKAVEKYGVAMFHRLNTLSFADGGWVGPQGGWGTPSFPNQSQPHLDKEAMNKQRDAILAAIQKFTLDVDSTVSQFKAAFERLQKRITDAGGRWTMALARDAERVDHLAEKYRKLQNKLDDQTQALATLQSQYDDITSQRGSLESNVAGVFHTSVTGGGIAGLDKALKGDIANRNQMDSLLAALRAAGLDSSGPQSGLYAELAQSGDIRTAQQLLAGGPGAISQYESLYARRDVLNQQSASAQGELAFGAMQDALVGQLTAQQEKIDKTTDAIHDTKVALRQELKGMREDLHSIVPEKIGDEVGDALTGATRNGRNRGRRKR